MADWWEQDTQSGGTATATKWWENDPEPGMRTETLPNDQPFQMAEGTSFNELMQTAIAGQPAARQANIDRMVGTLPEDATRLEELNFKRRQELITGEPANPTGDKRLDDITRQRLAKEIADMNAKGLGPDEMLLEERYQAEQDPLTNLINAPIMRGAMTGVQNAASSIAETALRILPGEGAPSHLADKIGRQRAAEGQYQAYLDEKQGEAAGLVNTVTQMTGEYMPLSVLGAPAAAQVAVKGANDAYLKSDSDTYALTSGIVQGALTYAGGKLAGGTWIDMIGGKVAGKKLAPLLKGYGIESGEELGQLYGQAMIDRGFGVGDGKMPTAKDALRTLAVVVGARSVGTAMSAGIEDDGVNKPSVERQAWDAMKRFAERKWPSRKLAKEAGVDQVATTAKERADLASDIRDRLTGQQFEEQLRAAAVSPEQADLDMEIYRAKAIAAGETFDEYVGKRVKAIEKTTSDNSVYMAQRQSGKPDALAQDIDEEATYRPAFNYDENGNPLSLRQLLDVLDRKNPRAYESATESGLDAFSRGLATPENADVASLEGDQLNRLAENLYDGNLEQLSDIIGEFTSAADGQSVKALAKELQLQEGIPDGELNNYIKEFGTENAYQRFVEEYGMPVPLMRALRAAAPKVGKGDRSFADFYDTILGGPGQNFRDTVLAQKNAPKPRGEIQFHKDDGRATIRLFEGANESTFIHESAHLFRRDLQGEDLKKAERWAGARNGKWNRKAEEKFARGFERYLREGIAPNKSLETIFARFKAALTKVYGAIKGTAIDVNISPEMRTVFDRLLTPSGNQDGNQVGNLNTQNPAISEALPPTDGNLPATEPATPDILSQDLADRFRGLANRAVDQRARDANFAVDEAMGIPGTRERQVAVNEADGRLKADPVGEARKFLAAIDEADRNNGAIPLTEADLRVYTTLIEEAGKDISTPENRALHAKMQRGFRQGMTELARVMGTRDPTTVMDPEARKRKSIVDAVTYTPSSDPADAAAMEERYNTAKEALAKQGIDLDDIDSIVADPKKAMVVLDHLRVGGNFGDVLYEYWRNAILSGPATQTTNIIGNTAFGAWNLGPERAAEAAINLFTRNKKAASFGEFRYLLGGALPGIVRGIRNARTSWSLETSALAEELGREGAFKIDGPRGAIKGRMGRLVRALGYRPLLAADEFAKSVVVTMEVGARAYRHGKELGLEGNELQTFIQQQTDDLASVSWSEAFAKAEELTFQGHRGMVAQNLSKAGSKLRGFPGARWVLPFIDTPSAIFEQGIKRMPVLGAILDYAESRRSGMNLVDAGLTPTLARQIIAFGGLALLWEAVSGDDPWITGADALSDPKGRDVAFRVQQPMSIRIGDEWYSYARMEPFATAIATTADSVKGIQNGKYYKPVTGLFQQAKEKSYLDGLGDAIDAIQGFSKGETAPAEQWGGKFIASWVPNLYRQTIRAAEGEMPENRMWGKSDDRFKRFLNRVGQQAGLPFVESQPRFDVWGQPINYNDMGNSPATSFAFRLFSPVKAKDLSTIQQADMALVRWNEKHPDDKEDYSEPQKYIKIQDQTQYLTDEQHAQYAELSGQLAQQYVSGIAFDPVNPTAQQIARIKKAIANARERARKQLIPTWTFD